MLNFLDQQVGLHFRDIIENVLLQVVGPFRLGGHFKPPVAYMIGVVSEPVALVLQILFASLFPIAFFK
ncbi:hypothetical protein D3C80_2002470 [compost metagenome]